MNVNKVLSSVSPSPYAPSATWSWHLNTGGPISADWMETDDYEGKTVKHTEPVTKDGLTLPNMILKCSCISILTHSLIMSYITH